MIEISPICDTEAQNPTYVILGFLVRSYFTLHLPQNTFYRIKYFVSNRRYTRLIRLEQSKKRKNRKKT